MPRFFDQILATTKSFGIGKDGGLPWHLSTEFKFFSNITKSPFSDPLIQNAAFKKNALIMGRKTYDSLPKEGLQGRYSLVVSNSLQETQEMKSNGVSVFRDFDSALSFANSEISDCGRIFVIGGKQLYESTVNHPLCRQIFHSVINKEYECNLFLNQNFHQNTFHEETSQTFVDLKQKAPFVISRFSNKNFIGEKDYQKYFVPHEEFQYLDSLKNILVNGHERKDRTGTGTISLFGGQMRFSLRNGVFPLLTTKKTFFRGVVEELLWMIRGCTNSTELSSKGVKIWDGNGSREFLDANGFSERQTGDLGPVYGFQWRHFGAKYKNMNENYRGEGFDQLQNLIREIKTNPDSRRLIITAWNPPQIKEMALPPCHMFAQFYVLNGELSCQLYQRSADMGLGVPFNIASYSLLTCMIAKVCNLKPGEFVHTIGDMHIYKNHIEALNEQVKRLPCAFPLINISREVKEIDDFKAEDFDLQYYFPQGKIKMEMSV